MHRTHPIVPVPTTSGMPLKMPELNYQEIGLETQKIGGHFWSKAASRLWMKTATPHKRVMSSYTSHTQAAMNRAILPDIPEQSGCPIIIRQICLGGMDIVHSNLLMFFTGMRNSIILILGLLPSTGFAANDDSKPPLTYSAPFQTSDGFHINHTEAEAMLNSLLSLAGADSDVVPFAVGYPKRKVRDDLRFTPFFSKPLLTAWRRAEAEAVKKNCNGAYVEGEMCGIDTQPITCSQEFADGLYIFRTEKATENIAVISYRWSNDAKILATYRMIKSGNRWIMDGVSCTGYLKFNMP